MIRNYMTDLVLMDADGGGAGAAPAAGTQAAAQGGTGVTVPAAGEQTNRRPWAEVKGDYKEEYGEEVRQTVTRRLQSVNEKLTNYKKSDKAQRAFIGRVAANLGLEPDENGAYDLDAVSKAYNDNWNRGLEDRALDAGRDVDTQRQLESMKEEKRQAALAQKEAQREAAEAEEAARKERADQELYNRVLAETKEAQKTYPKLDINTELTNPKFANLLFQGWTVQDAYQAVHAQEIVTAGMGYAEQVGAQNVARSVAANRGRPVEGAMGTPGAVVTGRPIPKTLHEFDEIARRAARGETIVF